MPDKESLNKESPDKESFARKPSPPPQHLISPTITQTSPHTPPQSESHTSPYGLQVFWSLAWRFALEWAAAVGVGAGIGLWADELWNLEPWGFIIGLLLGSMAGVLNMYRSCQKYFTRSSDKSAQS